MGLITVSKSVLKGNMLNKFIVWHIFQSSVKM